MGRKLEIGKIEKWQKSKKLQNKRQEQKERIREAFSGVSDVVVIPPTKQYENDKKQILRVAVYCRVSTLEESQASSFELQLQHYREMIEKNPEWELVEIYADEGVSGTSMKKRIDFRRMIDDCDAGKIDLIVTKSVSRFARNTRDCLEVARQLKSLNPPVGILFETEGFNTAEIKNEFMLGVLSLVAQGESETKSAAILWSILERFKKGIPIFSTHNLLGYDKNRYGKVVIIEEEAEVIRQIYGIAVATKRDWPDGSYINAGDPARSIRTHVEKGKRILIVVGETHATARGEDNMELHFENLTQFAERIAGVNELLAKWSAQDYDTPDQIPYIGRLSDNSNIYVAAGFKKWGLSNGTLSGNMIAELITNGNCRYEELYSRKRGDYLSATGKTISEVFGSVGELIKSKFENTESIHDLKPGERRVINFEGQKAEIYRDNDDNVTILDISCTHMTTELNFNVAEKTWDCPAHGGRFSTDGRLLEGPPKDSLQVLYRGKFSDLVTVKGR